MSLKYGLLSILALGVVLTLCFKNYEIWTQPIELFPKPQKEETRPVEKKKEALPITGLAKDTPAIQSYISIAEKNIFNPERKDFPVLGGTKKSIARPQVVLYGVTIVGGYQAASVANPGRPVRKGERETFTVKLGEKIGEYKLAKISSDRITLEAEGDNFEVLLYDPSMPKKRIEVRTEVKPAPIITTQPTPAAPAPGIIRPPAPSVSTEAPKPSPSPQAVAPPPPAQTPVRPSIAPPDTRRGRRPYYPPTGTPGVPGTSTQETEGNQ